MAVRGLPYTPCISTLGLVDLFFLHEHRGQCSFKIYAYKIIKTERFTSLTCYLLSEWKKGVEKIAVPSVTTSLCHPFINSIDIMQYYSESAQMELSNNAKKSSNSI